MVAGNVFLPAFMERFNERFAVRAAKPDDLYRRLSMAPARMNEILCHREQRYVGAQLILSYDRMQIILEQTDVAKGLVGQDVEIYEFADGRIEVRWKGSCLPYRVFRKNQRVSHTAIVENKRLSHALRVVKAQQDHKLATKVMTNSEKTLYKKRPRQVFGSDFDTKSTGPAAVEMMEIA